MPDEWIIGTIPSTLSGIFNVITWDGDHIYLADGIIHPGGCNTFDEAHRYVRDLFANTKGFVEIPYV